MIDWFDQHKWRLGKAQKHMVTQQDSHKHTDLTVYEDLLHTFILIHVISLTEVQLQY